MEALKTTTALLTKTRVGRHGRTMMRKLRRRGINTWAKRAGAISGHASTAEIGILGTKPRNQRKYRTARKLTWKARDYQAMSRAKNRLRQLRPTAKIERCLFDDCLSLRNTMPKQMHWYSPAQITYGRAGHTVNWDAYH